MMRSGLRREAVYYRAAIGGQRGIRNIGEAYHHLGSPVDFYLLAKLDGIAVEKGTRDEDRGGGRSIVLDSGGNCRFDLRQKHFQVIRQGRDDAVDSRRILHQQDHGGAAPFTRKNSDCKRRSGRGFAQDNRDGNPVISKRVHARLTASGEFGLVEPVGNGRSDVPGAFAALVFGSRGNGQDGRCGYGGSGLKHGLHICCVEVDRQFGLAGRKRHQRCEGEESADHPSVLSQIGGMPPVGVCDV